MVEEEFEKIEDLGSALRKQVNTQLKGVNNVTVLLKIFVEALGGKIVGTKDPEVFEVNGGSLLIKRRGNFLIRLPMDTSPLRDNFTIAHELGHYFLHYKDEDGVRLFARYGNDSKEIQANRFAAAFLMPKEEFLKVSNDCNNYVPFIASHFQVSTDVVEERLKYING